MEQPTPLPDWLTVPDPPEPKPSPEKKALVIAQYEMVFPRVLDYMYGGSTLANAIRDINRGTSLGIDQGGFYRWLQSDPKRRELYKEAKEVRTEAWAGKIIEYAEGKDENGNETLEDVARSKLKVDTLKWLMGADNRKQYGDTKQIEVNQNISITAALAAAQGRLQDVIEAELVEDVKLLSDGEDE